MKTFLAVLLFGILILLAHTPVNVGVQAASCKFSFTPSSFTAGVETVVTVTVTDTIAGHKYKASAEGTEHDERWASPGYPISSGGTTVLTIEPLTASSSHIQILVSHYNGDEDFLSLCSPSEGADPDDPDTGIGPVEGGGGDDTPVVNPGVTDGGFLGDSGKVAGGIASTFLTFGVGIGGGIAFLLMVFGAYRLMFAAGNPESIQQGQQIITAAIAGLIVIVFAVFILRFLGFTILGIEGLV